MTNVQTLVVNNTLNNAMKDLQLAKNTIVKMQSIASTTSVQGTLNQTLSLITGSVKKTQNQANGKGVNTKNCTNKLFSQLLGVGIDGASRVAACPVDEGSKAISMINGYVAYVSELTNLTMFAPQALNNCIFNGNKTTVQRAQCTSTYLSETSTKLINAPAKVTSMVNDAYAYVAIFPTNIAVCATNSSFVAIGNAATLALNITACITAAVIGS